MNNMMKALKYDSSLEENITLYDNLPYTRNLAVCGNDCIRMFSGNVVKYATYNELDVKEVPNNDDLMLARIQKERELEQMKRELEESELSEDSIVSEETETE